MLRREAACRQALLPLSFRERLIKDKCNTNDKYSNPENSRHRCERAVSPTKPAAQGVRSRSISLPARDYDCNYFRTQAEAQRILDSTPGEDPHKLDADRDHIACESLP